MYFEGDRVHRVLFEIYRDVFHCSFLEVIMDFLRGPGSRLKIYDVNVRQSLATEFMHGSTEASLGDAPIPGP